MTRSARTGAPISVAILLLVACTGKEPSRLVSPSATVTSVGAFSVSGIVTELRGGPIANATVTAIPLSRAGTAVTAMTGADGSYGLDALGEPVVIQVAKEGFLTTNGIPLYSNAVVNMSLRRRLVAAAGETLTAAIWYDDILDFEDVPGCGAPTACIAIRVTAPAAGDLTARLTWSAASTALEVQMLNTFDIRSFTLTGPVARGSSPLELTANVSAGETILIVRFASPPSPGSGEAFELTTSLK